MIAIASLRRPRAAMPALAALLWLAACGTAKAPEPVADPAPAFRDTAAPIASSLRGAASDLNGDWVVAAAYPGGPVRAGTRMTLDLDDEGGAARISEDGAARLLPVIAQGRGRFEADGAPWWLLWADDGFRTAAIGAPDGAHGWIMHRPGQAAADRTRAAREMLDFNGYDTGALEAATGG